MTLVLRKLLASSTFAIAGAQETISHRLKAKLQQQTEGPSLEEELTSDYEALDTTAEEWPEEETDPLSPADLAALQNEIVDLDTFAALALPLNTTGVVNYDLAWNPSDRAVGRCHRYG